ncbi:MAG TPA: tRNA pseudouridine(55) synthase TruB [Cyanothece sp. UBA12306]|nr:tRNA pseudouridine(55) synthase TruB [Cyanothece sp. UBA12306]
MFGFIALNKPSGITSHDCVARVRKILKLKKVGHGGTLDPLATGVLPIAVGSATRLLAFLPEKKAYRAKIRLGVQTTTDDLEGEVISSQVAPNLTLEQVEPLLRQFIGTIPQIPPMYSAIQKDGQRLYDLARKGENVDVPTRNVRIDEIKVINWYSGDFPELEIDIFCGAGTYIRAIARDLGAMLNLGGTLASLIRTESCGMKLSDSITLEQLKLEIEQGTFSLISPDLTLQHLPQITLSETDTKRWFHGQRIAQDLSLLTGSDFVRVHQEGGNLIGIGKLTKTQTYQVLSPKIVLA